MDSPSDSSLSALGFYLLTSLIFVFGAMAEFALILVVKQKIDWKKAAINDTHNVSILEDEKTNTANISKKSGKIGPMKEMNLGLKTSKEKRIGRSSLLLSTTKIDLFAFVLFNFSYFIFNGIYWTSYP